jgi:hypothetical protein
MTDDTYVIWSIEHQAWWRPGSMGYCLSLHDAGRYAEREAAEILSRANLVAFHEAMIPVSAVGAAPELLEALNVAESFLRHLTEDSRGAAGALALAVVRGAIAKAEGRR